MEKLEQKVGDVKKQSSRKLKQLQDLLRYLLSVLPGRLFVVDRVDMQVAREAKVI